MEYKELEILWKQYDEKLNNLEKINRKLLKATLLQKPQKRLNWLEFKTLYSLIAPLILLIALHPNFKTENIDWKFIIGCALAIAVIVYLTIENIRIYSTLKKMNLNIDTVIQTLEKIIRLKKIATNFQKNVFVYYPAIFAGCTLIGWNSFIFSTNTIVFLSILFALTYYANIWGVGRYKERINRLEKDIIELKEYAEV